MKKSSLKVASKSQARRKQDASKTQEVRKQIINRMKWLPFNRILVYLCDELKDDMGMTTTTSICKDLKISYNRVFQIFRDLVNLNYLRIWERGIGLNSYFGVFENNKLKLKEFENLARIRVRGLTHSPKKKKVRGKNGNN
ncbi:MAG TPA: hypothetical protein VMZ91_03075 [Candidatus Paceibacterota bacterium]|nr:hypothetical protein [Candidatus Paceibacterota bacterium]